MPYSNPRTNSGAAFVLLLLALAIIVCAPARAANIFPYWQVSGTRIVSSIGNEPLRLRGFNVCWWVPPTEADAVNIKAMGANCVRYMFGYDPKGAYDPKQIEEVQQQIRCFTQQGLWVVPVLYMFRRDDPADRHRKLDPWSTPEMNAEFLALWTDLIGRLKGDPLVAAWEPINEPHDVKPEVAAAWYRALIPQLRKLDPYRPIVIEGANYSHAEDLSGLFKMDDPNIIYAFHHYYPFEFTTDLKTPPLAYPGKWGKAYLAKIIDPADRFREKYNVPVWCGEFGCKTGAPGYQLWLRDSCAILEANQFDWCIWAWALQPKDPKNDTFDINLEKPAVLGVVTSLFRETQNPSQPR